MPSFDFMNNPIIPGQAQQQYNIAMEQRQQIIPTMESPKDNVVVGGFKFTVKADNDTSGNIPIVNNNADIGLPDKRRTRKPKDESNEVAAINGSDIVRADGTVEDKSTFYSYSQTTSLLSETLQQVDIVASDIKEELDSTRLNRTLKNRQNAIIGLSDSLGQLLNTKISIIKEINNAISKSNEMDYRKEKDRKAADSNMGDDKYIMDLYNSFIKNPMNNPNQQTMLGPSMINSTISSIGGTGIIRSPLANQAAGQQGQQNNQPVDLGYLNYLSRVSPEQNMMFYEQDPNVKTVVVFDASTGNKFFQVMNLATGQTVPNVPVLDDRFMEDTYVDIKTKIAKNNNLHETYPVVIINENIVSEY